MGKLLKNYKQKDLKLFSQISPKLVKKVKISKRKVGKGSTMRTVFTNLITLLMGKLLKNYKQKDHK